jgi:hypothetical protein
MRYEPADILDELEQCIMYNAKLLMSTCSKVALNAQSLHDIYANRIRVISEVYNLINVIHKTSDTPAPVSYSEEEMQEVEKLLDLFAEDVKKEEE